MAPQGSWLASKSSAILRSQARCSGVSSTRTSQASASSIFARSCWMPFIQTQRSG